MASSEMASVRRTCRRSARVTTSFRLSVVLFRQDVLRRVGEGEVTLAFRRWRRPTVKAGGTLRTSVGVLASESVEGVDESDVTDADARRAGAPDREAVLREGPRERPLYRVE